MKRVLKKLAHNSINTSFIKISGILTTIYASNTLGTEEFGEYSLSISLLIIVGSTFFAFASQTFSIENTTSLLTNNKNILYIIHLFFILLITLFFSYSCFFYISASIIVVASYYNSQLLENNLHLKMTKLNSISILSFFSILFLVHTLTPTTNLLVLIYSSPFFIIVLAGLPRLKTGNDKANFRILAKWFFGFLSAALIPITFSALYSILKNENNIKLLGDFFSIMQWFFIFGQINQVFGNVLIRNHNNLLKHQEVFISVLPILIFTPFIFVISSIHNQIFNKNISESELSICLTYLAAHNFINCYKSHIGRNIILKNKQGVSLLSNAIWSILVVALFNIYVVTSLKEASMIIFFSSLAVTILFFPYFHKKELVFAHDKKTVFTSLFCVIIFIVETTAFGKIE